MRHKIAKSVTIAAAMACMLAGSAHAAMTISNAQTKNVTCTGGVCTPTRAKANLNVGDLQTMLASSDVTVKSGANAPTLGVIDAVTWASTYRLTLDAYQSIHVKAPIVIEGTAGLTLTTNDGGTGGDYLFENGGSANFWDLASSLIINGNRYTLVGDIKTLASDIISGPSGPYALARSYDASADGTYTNSPIESFGSTLEGLGNQFLNLTVLVGQHRHNYAGLISVLSGTVRDVGLANANISVTFGTAGAIAAYNPSGTIIHASASGTVTAEGRNSNAGGLVGENYSQIVDSSADVRVDGTHAGGLAGRNGRVITFCRAIGSVSSSLDAGGLVGWNSGQIHQSYATGTATAVKEGARAGGLVGLNDYNSWIFQSYATGPATGNVPNTQAGGLIGMSKPKGWILENYSTGSVSVVSGLAGGFVGVDRAGASGGAYWDLDTSGITDPNQGAGSPYGDPAITGLTDAQLKSAVPANFDPNIWGQNASINNGWPYLLANPPPQ